MCKDHELDAGSVPDAELDRRDHRRLGRQMDLFSVHEDVGAGLIFWHPKLATVRATIEDFWRDEHRRRKYQFVYTPHIAKEWLYEVSGHLQSYGQSMYAAMDIDGQPYRIKPMNCPGHIKIYNSRQRSHRELPLRLAELGTVYRHEGSGSLHGMLRVRGFTQDDSHIFCTPEQLESEITGVIDLIQLMMKTFGYSYKAFLATRPANSLGSDAEWEFATAGLKAALQAREMPFEIDEGGGAFYAPKIDVKLYDAIGREWQGPTVQVDLNLPQRFDISYIGQDGRPHRPIMVHRAVLGSMERFCGGLIEHYAGAFPTWLAPVQVAVVPIADRHHQYARQVEAQLAERMLRAIVDDRPETLNARIRDNQNEQIPYMLVVGDREMQNGQVAVRHRRDQSKRATMPVTAFIEQIVREVGERAL